MSQPANPNESVRVVLGKLRLDAHNRGFNYVAMQLRDAGMEVIPMKVATTLELVRTAVQEGADAIGLSILTGAHLIIAGDLMQQIKEAGRPDLTVVVGGIIPREDVAKLEALGVDGVFPATTTDTKKITSFIQEKVHSKRAGRA